MFDINRHKLVIVYLLKDIFSDPWLSNSVGFKGGTALMMFHNLPRFSVDIDLNLLDISQENIMFKKLKNIVLKYGRIKDEAIKHFGSIIVLDYGENDRNLKIEISNREFGDRYEINDFLGIKMKVMNKTDMFSHKLCALSSRNTFANRDVFDCWFFMKDRTPINRRIIEERMNTGVVEYLNNCMSAIEKITKNRILDGLGELVDDTTKHFVRNSLKSETISMLKTYAQFPIYDD